MRRGGVAIPKVEQYPGLGASAVGRTRNGGDCHSPNCGLRNDSLLFQADFFRLLFRVFRGQHLRMA